MNRADVEIWGGHECTVNRVGDAYFDQTVRSGHHDRIDDLDRFAGVGLRKLRYPILWERTWPEPASAPDFRWADARMERMGALRIEPIVGLLHHGSGPRHTSLLDPDFPQKFAAFADVVAARYPHVRDWTPVNEPLTTARFSCLYGLWHPHARDETALWAALLNQIDGVRLAMGAIRAWRPAARLIQTEDLGKAYGVGATVAQAAFENDRRWLTWDLLCGRVVPGHALHDRIAALGFDARLQAIAEHACPPDVIGVNHYLTSDRFLDAETEHYPPHVCGGNGKLAYADVEALRVMQPAPGGLAGVLEEAWGRYGRPLALTEAHNGCTREDQVRWLQEAWDTAHRLRGQGVDIRAVTAWSLLGSFDWDSLLTEQRGHYECGVFDLRSDPPRPTAAAALLQAWTGERPKPPIAAGDGWWRRDERLLFPPVRCAQGDRSAASIVEPPVLIVGATGTLGRMLARTCAARGLTHIVVDRGRLDLGDPHGVERLLDDVRPWAVINAAGWVRVDDAEADEAGCDRANASGAVALASACAARDCHFTGFSSDLVFSGVLHRAYVETDAVGPLSAYGRSKVGAEQGVLALDGRMLMVRTAAFFSAEDPYNFASHVRCSLEAGRSIAAADDLVMSPTYVVDLANAVLDLVIDDEVGLWHLTNETAVSWASFARMVARGHGLDDGLVSGRPALSFGWPAERPANSALASLRGQILPSLEDALDRYRAACRSLDGR